MLFFLAQTAVEADTVKPWVIPADSIKTDSLAADTLPQYKIPEVADLSELAVPDPGSIGPLPIDDENLYLSDVFLTTPDLVKNGFLYRRGNGPHRTEILLNNQLLNSRLLGYFDIERIPAQFIERISIASEAADFHTLINRYDRPYSHIRFMILGKTTLYNINFTRPITNEMGFYLAGVYRKTRVQESGFSAYETSNSFYGDYYWNNYLKSRLDFLYNNSITGEIRKSEFFTASLVLGRREVFADIHYKYDRFDLDSSRIRAADASYGVTLSGLHDLKFVRLGWHGTVRADDIYVQDLPSPRKDRSDRSIQGGFSAVRGWGRFLGIATADLGYIGGEGFFPAVKANIDFRPFNSVSWFVELGRSYRIPSFSELDSNSHVFDPDFPRIGNPELVPEFVWRQETGVRYRDLSVTLYRNDYENYIQDRWDPIGQYVHTINIPRASFLGVETASDLPLAWGFRLGFGGDYLIHSDLELLHPKYRAGAELDWQAERGRARFKIFGRGRYLGPDVPGGRADLRPVFTLGALVRFVTLTTCLKVENLLDDANLDFPVPERDISLSVKWEFLD